MSRLISELIVWIKGVQMKSVVHLYTFFGSLLTAHSQELPCVCSVLNENSLTAGVTGAGAGVDSVWGQKKLEATRTRNA